MDARERDVVIVTLDSCRYDTALRASTPNLDGLGRLVKAETCGTYTLPAHVGFFGGQFPRPLDGVYPFAGRKLAALWRSAAARPTPGSVAVAFEGPTLLDHYRARGFRIIGAGGVSFFDPEEPGNWLPGLFDEFHYFGRPNRATGDRVRDRADSLTLSHVGLLADACASSRRFLLFLNCPSTHIPYTTPRSPLTARTARVLRSLYALHDRKVFGPVISAEDTAILLDLQRKALEWADERLGELFDLLRPREPLVVVCADHGEEFGEGGRYGHGHPHPTVMTVPLWCGLLSKAAGR
jgi:Arylsulfatase A and related enzymes